MGSSKGVGIPIKLFHESEGHVLTVEVKTGETFRGELHEAEDNFNCQLRNVTATSKDGRVTHMDNVYIRGSQVRFIVVPDMLKQAPMFKRIDPKVAKQMKGMPIGTGGRGRGAPSSSGGRGRGGMAPMGKPPPRR